MHGEEFIKEGSWQLNLIITHNEDCVDTSEAEKQIAAKQEQFALKMESL